MDKKISGSLYTLEEANTVLKQVFPHLTLLKYTGAKILTDVRSDTCGHIWKGSLGNITSKIGGHICRICTPSGSARRSLDTANSKLQEKYSDLEFLEYSGSNAEATIKSNQCGHTWVTRPRNLLSGHSGYICRVCSPASNSKLTLQGANLRLLNLFPDLEFINYNGLQIPSLIKSKTCNHTWNTTLNNITTGNTPATCPVCNPRVFKISKGEKEVLEYIKSVYDGWVIENDRLFISPLELDILVPDLGIAIEFNGGYWHREDKTRHINKTELVESTGYRLIHINSDEWLHKRDIVKSRLLAILGKSDRIFARNTKLQEIPFPKEFLEINHIQGAGAPTSINLGLFHDETMVAVMTFSRPRFNNDNDYELVRYCSLLNTTVVGGASKLLSYFNNNYIGSIVSYSDKRWSTGNLYKKLGFKYSHTSPPNYRYHKSEYSLSRYQCQKHLLKDRFPQYYKEELSETEIMTAAGYYKVYDCGNDVWIYE